MPSIQLSLVIASMEPKKLSGFYAFATNGELFMGKNDEHWMVVLENGMSLHLYKPSANRPWPPRGRVSSLCLQKEPSSKPLLSIGKWSAKLVKLGAKVTQQPQLESFGAESWMNDPEGNSFLIFVPSI